MGGGKIHPFRHRAQFLDAIAQTFRSLLRDEWNRDLVRPGCRWSRLSSIVTQQIQPDKEPGIEAKLPDERKPLKGHSDRRKGPLNTQFRGADGRT